MKKRLSWMFCLFLPAAFCGSQGPAYSAQAFKVAPAYFIGNEVHAKTGTALVANPDVVAFVQTRQGRILFTRAGAFIGMPERGIKSRTTGEDLSKTQVCGEAMIRRGSLGTAVFKMGIASECAQEIVPRLAERTEAHVNFFIGDPSSWRAHVPTYRKLVYDDVFDGVTLEFLGFMDRLEYRLIVESGADPQLIELETGADRVHVDDGGQLIAALGSGRLIFAKPLAYQCIDGQHVSVSVRYVALDDGRFGFALGEYDTRFALIIDPELTWSTYLSGEGGHGVDQINDVAVNTTGEIVFTGYTESAAFPTTPGCFQSSQKGIIDAVLGKLDAVGEDLLFCTYFGGSEYDEGASVDVDSSGDIYMAGLTGSDDLPTTASAYDTSFNGVADGFVAKFSKSGRISYSTYLGGAGDDECKALAVSPAGVTYVVGVTDSRSFPTTPGAISPTNNGGSDIFVTRLDSLGEDLIFSTYFGGALADGGYGAAIDATDHLYVTGFTFSDDFPTTFGAYDRTHNGADDGFVAKFTKNGNVVYSTYIGGSSGDGSSGVAVSASDQAYVVGATYSADFPTTTGAYDEIHNGGADAFVAKLDAAGSKLDFATFLGDVEDDSGRDITVTPTGYAYLTGVTLSPNFPTTPGAYSQTHVAGYDAFVACMDANGTTLGYSTFLGASESDWANAIALDDVGGVVIAGDTTSMFFPTTVPAFDHRPSSEDNTRNGFVTRFNPDLSDLVFSTLIRGNGNEYRANIALDDEGDVYVAGITESPVFPTTSGVVSETYNGNYDVLVCKLSNTGHDLVYSTYLGGNREELAAGIAVDGSGNAHIVGSTQSPGFPTTSGAFDEVHSGSSTDLFVTKLNDSGSALLFSTFLGAAEFESAAEIVLDGSGYAVITGRTFSDLFPTTPGAYDTTFNGNSDAFVTRLNNTGTALSYSTFLGGDDADQGLALSLDGFGNAYVGGQTDSENFPVTPGAYNTIPPITHRKAFVAKLNSTGTNLTYCTYLGGSAHDRVDAIAVDDAGIATVAGRTESSGFPTTPGALDTSFNGDWDAFVTQFNASGSALLFSTFLGGSGHDSCRDLALDADGYPILVGLTESTGFPTTSDALDTTLDGTRDGFVSALHSDGTFLIFSTYLGGNDEDYAQRLALDAYDNALITGLTASSDFPTTTGAYDQDYGGDQDIFVAKVSLCEPPGPPDAINGPDHVCLNETGVVYSVSPVAGATSYDWTVPTNAVITDGQGTQTITVDFADNPGDVTVAAVDACGPGAIAVLAVSLDEPPVVLDDPDHQMVCPGETASFQVTMTVSTGMSYQWFKDGIELSDDGRITGSMTASLEIASLLVTDEGVYHCDIGNACDVVSSAAATLTVDGPVQVHIEPGIAVKGIPPLELAALVDCAVPTVTYAWTLDPPSPYVQNDPTITVDPPPSSPLTHVDVLIEDSSKRETASDQAALLVSQNPLFFDYNGDGFNNLEDIREAAPMWRLTLPDDPNEDGIMDVRDYLFINLDDSLDGSPDP